MRDRRSLSRRSAVLILTAVVATFAATTFWRRDSRADIPATGAHSMLAHNVYFTLNESSPANRKKLVDACHQYLSAHPGTLFYAAGTLCEDLNRPVNDLDYDVGLHIIFKDRASHDAYQTAPLHLQFIAENKETWKKVRVFDTNVTGVPK